MVYELVLGNRVYSGWSLRVWLLLKQIGADFKHQVVPLYTDDFDLFRRAYYPARQLPTLIVTENGTRTIIWDSLSITEYLNEHHPESMLLPADAAARATARSLCAEMHSGFKALRSKMPFNLKRRYRTFEPDSETRNDIARICNLWAWVRTEYCQGGPFLFGQDFTAADAFFAPVALRFQTYSIQLDELSRAYTETLLHHPATIEFVAAAQAEEWVMEHNEFDMD